MLLFSQIMNEYPAYSLPIDESGHWLQKTDSQSSHPYDKRSVYAVQRRNDEQNGHDVLFDLKRSKSTFMKNVESFFHRKKTNKCWSPLSYFLFSCSLSGTALPTPSAKKLMTTIPKKPIPAIREIRVSSLIHIPMRTMMRKAIVR